MSDIEAKAREIAHYHLTRDYNPSCEITPEALATEGHEYACNILTNAIASALLQERERCAKIAETIEQANREGATRNHESGLMAASMAFHHTAEGAMQVAKAIRTPEPSHD